MGTVAALASSTDWRLELAGELERLACQLRAGEVIADQAVVVLRNQAGGMMHKPHRMGMPTSPSEAMGLLAYGSHHLYQVEVGE